MRLTSFLSIGKRVPRQKLEYLTKSIWRKNASKFEVDRLLVPDQVMDNPNNPLRNAENMFLSDRYEQHLIEEVEIGISPNEALQLEQEKSNRLAIFKRGYGDLRHHSNVQSCLTFTNKRRFSKGLDQASLLTNTLIFNETPPPGLNQIIEKVANICEVHSDASTNTSSSPSSVWSQQLKKVVERSILHSHTWHTDESKLPRRFNPNLPIWKHKSEYGIGPEQITRYLFHNLFRIMEFETPNLIKFANLNAKHHSDFDEKSQSNNLPSRWTTRDRFLETYYYYNNNNGNNDNNGRRINFAEFHDMVIHARQPLSPFVWDSNQIGALCDKFPLPIHNLGPMSPLIDLITNSHYREESTNGWLASKTRSYPHVHLFTINLSLPNMWSDYLEPESDPVTPHQRQSTALMHCYASAIAQAHATNEFHTTADLQEPICIQAVCSDGVYFDFITLQLNTLIVPDLKILQSSDSTNTPVTKNFAWIDGHHRLFEKAIPKRSALRNTKYQDLDMNVFYRLASYYVWGLLNHSDYIKRSGLDLYTPLSTNPSYALGLKKL